MSRLLLTLTTPEADWLREHLLGLIQEARDEGAPAPTEALGLLRRLSQPPAQPHPADRHNWLRSVLILQRRGYTPADIERLRHTEELSRVPGLGRHRLAALRLDLTAADWRVRVADPMHPAGVAIVPACDYHRYPAVLGIQHHAALPHHKEGEHETLHCARLRVPVGEL